MYRRKRLRADNGTSADVVLLHDGVLPVTYRVFPTCNSSPGDCCALIRQVQGRMVVQVENIFCNRKCPLLYSTSSQHTVWTYTCRKWDNAKSVLHGRVFFFFFCTAAANHKFPTRPMYGSPACSPMVNACESNERDKRVFCESSSNVTRWVQNGLARQ
jgi:hypothetical protein